MTARKILAMLLCALLALCPCALSESDEDLRARIDKLEAELAEKDAAIEDLRAQLAEAGIASYSDADPAAEFDGGSVSIEAAKAEYDYRAYYYSMFAGDMSESEDDIKQEVLENLVEDAILEMKAKEMGVYDIGEEELSALRAEAQASLDEMVGYYKEYRYQEGMTDEALRQDTLEYLAGEGYTLESILEGLTAESWRDRLYQKVTKDVTITDAEMKAYFEEAASSQQMIYSADYGQYETDLQDGELVLWNPEGMRAVRYVLVGFTGEKADEYASLLLQLEGAGDEELLQKVDDMFASLEPIVEEIQTRLEAGDDFALLIDEYSADEAFQMEPARSGGIYVSADSTCYDDAFKAAAMALESAGDVSEPVRTSDGVYFIEYLADVQPGSVDFDSVKELLGGIALGEEKDNLYGETVDQWIADANVKYYPDRI